MVRLWSKFFFVFLFTLCAAAVGEGTGGLQVADELAGSEHSPPPPPFPSSSPCRSANRLVTQVGHSSLANNALCDSSYLGTSITDCFSGPRLSRIGDYGRINGIVAGPAEDDVNERYEDLRDATLEHIRASCRRAGGEMRFGDPAYRGLYNVSHSGHFSSRDRNRRFIRTSFPSSFYLCCVGSVNYEDPNSGDVGYDPYAEEMTTY